MKDEVVITLLSHSDGSATHITHFRLRAKATVPIFYSWTRPNGELGAWREWASTKNWEKHNLPVLLRQLAWQYTGEQHKDTKFKGEVPI